MTKPTRITAGIVLTLALTGCATRNGYREAFSPADTIKDSTQSFARPEPTVWPAVLTTLARQGFTVSSANEQAGVISATRLMQDPNDNDLSYHVDATVTVTAQDVSAGAQKTQVSLAANEETIRHQKYHTWWHLLWLIPIFPTGTEYNTVVRRERTVSNSRFYTDFFDALREELPKPPTSSSAQRTPSKPRRAGTSAVQDGPASGKS